MAPELLTRALEIAAEKVRRFEGCKLNAYPDIGGVMTIGFGETKNIVKGMQWTAKQADDALKFRLSEFMDGVLLSCPALHNLAPECLAACISLAYNIGLDAFGKSTVRKQIAIGNRNAAADAFRLWNKVQGRIVGGLVTRRESERNLFLAGVA